jgi:hypothetical protein
MINQINTERSVHIITVEDPIEYLHQHRSSIINQRELGQDTKSFAAALRSALREDPDVILVGEMRDLETIQLAITAAETGHLVFATLHTNNAAESIDRIVDVFPPGQQEQIRIQLANNLQAIVSQQLLPRAGQPGAVPAVEVMIATPAIRNLIRENKTHQIHTMIQTSGQMGMQTMDQSLRDLYVKGWVTYEEAMSRAINPDELRKMIAPTSGMPGAPARPARTLSTKEANENAVLQLYDSGRERANPFRQGRSAECRRVAQAVASRRLQVLEVTEDRKAPRVPAGGLRACQTQRPRHLRPPVLHNARCGRVADTLSGCAAGANPTTPACARF